MINVEGSCRTLSVEDDKRNSNSSSKYALPHSTLFGSIKIAWSSCLCPNGRHVSAQDDTTLTVNIIYLLNSSQSLEWHNIFGQSGMGIQRGKNAEKTKKTRADYHNEGSTKQAARDRPTLLEREGDVRRTRGVMVLVLLFLESRRIAPKTCISHRPSSSNRGVTVAPKISWDPVCNLL